MLLLIFPPADRLHLGLFQKDSDEHDVRAVGRGHVSRRNVTDAPPPWLTATLTCLIITRLAGS